MAFVSNYKQHNYRYTISQTKKMEELMKKTLDEVLDQVGQDTVQKLRVYIKQYWYDRYVPEDYERTESLVDCISYKKENGKVMIYFDESKVEHKDNGPGEWGSYTSFGHYDNGGTWVAGEDMMLSDDFHSGLIEFIENGKFNSGKRGSLNNPRHDMGGSHAVDKTKEWLRKYLNNEVQKRFKNLWKRVKL